jgi:catechol 2,3-dioxygenase-like lactoylglutathione lyase family enzyme
MPISGVTTQLRTTDLAASVRFYTERLGFQLAFQYQDFYAGIRVGSQMFHLKRVDAPDPSIAYVEEEGHFHLYFETADVAATAQALKDNGVPFVEDVHDTAWQTREFVVHDDQGHTLYFSEALPAVAPD